MALDLDPAANLFLGRELRKPALLAAIGKTGAEQAVAAIEGKEVKRDVETDLVAITKDDASSNEEFFYKQAC